MALVTFIVTALAAGAMACATNLATQSIQETYERLQALAGQRLKRSANGEDPVVQLEATPTHTARQRTLAEQLALAMTQQPDAPADEELAHLASTLLQLIRVEEQITGLTVIPSTGSQMGDGGAPPMQGRRAVSTPAAIKPTLLKKQRGAADPKLQRLSSPTFVEKGVPAGRAAASGKPFAAHAVVDLIGRLKDPRVPVPGLQLKRQVKDFFTATAALADIAAITQHDNIVTLQQARPLAPTLANSVPEIGGTPAQLRAALPDHSNVPDGSGVIIGIVDYGCDFVHPNFRHADGTTRILALWHQDGPLVEGVSPSGFAQGREFEAAAINAALQTLKPYETLAYDPGIASHGTHVMDIAAGNGRATGNPGVAPNAHLIFVDIGSREDRQARQRGNERNLMEAADYIFQKAAALGYPAVVNISIGTHSGPHDGSTPAERWFDELLQTPNRAIVISAGNSWRHRAHTQGVATAAKPALLPWIIQPNDTTDNEVEIWYGGAHSLVVTLLDPDGVRLATVPCGYTQSLVDATGRAVISIIHNEEVAGNHDHQINIWLDKSLTPPGATHAIWQIELQPAGIAEVPFHAWIERDDAASATQSFFHPTIVDTAYTLGSLSCGQLTIVVGSYMAGDPAKGLSAFSAAGPTRDGRPKPEVSAPGQYTVTAADGTGILAAESGTNGVTRKAGTSMAAPHVAGLIALLLQTAQGPLRIEQIRERLMKTVRIAPSGSAAWHARYGFGLVDVMAALSNQVESR